jgi:bifunctional UDP-N-acetylglucosamine pyrophosphorylase/glucosamine-1-phosphate N-acetyltransferase
LYGFAGRTLLGHVLAAVEPLGAEQTIVVVGHQRELVAQHLKEIAPGGQTVVQHEQRGTGHAVRVALDAVPADRTGTVIVVPGDAPLLDAAALEGLIGRDDAAVMMMTSIVDDPTGYGRVLRGPDGGVQGVVEQADLTADDAPIREIAAGVYAFDHAFLRDAITRLSTDNAQGQEYLPDVVRLAVEEGRAVGALTVASELTAGVNDRVQLAAAHRSYNQRLLEAHMRSGVTIIDPATTWVDVSVELEPDVTLLPNVQLHGTTTIATEAVIGPDCTLTDTSVGERSMVTRAVAVDATIGADVTAGPFVYLRPKTVLRDNVHLGTYVEVKNSDIGDGSKVPHLSYIGDATIGEKSNIGAATVTVNYDGVHKHRTVIGDHARTGADNMFVAPVEVGDGAYTAAGSIITEDVPPGAMAIARARQQNLAGWVLRNRAGTAADQAARAAGATDSETK